MLCLDNFSRQNKLDTKMQRANSTEMNFTTANCKIRKKDYVDIYFISKWLTTALATKYRFN